MTDKPIDLSLVVACYNEEPVLEESIRQTVEILDAMCWTYEIIFVDDCSKDRTRELIEKLVEEFPGRNFRKLYHTSNQGRGRTVSDGFRIAQGRVVGFIDIDLEVHARYIPSFVLAVQHGADLVTAHRIYKTHPRLFHRFVLSRGYSWLVQAMLGIRLNDTEAGFKFFRRERLLAVLDQIVDQGWFWDTEVIARFLIKHYRVEEIPCLFLKRYDKKSSVRVFRDTLDYLVKIWYFRPIYMDQASAGARPKDYAPSLAALQNEVSALTPSALAGNEERAAG
jgi:glycosyltransferase involved in cell wall biosynthesis